MIRGANLLIALVLWQGAPKAAPQPTSHYLKQATVSQEGDRMRITANSPRPLLQMIEALRQQFGWIVNYEEPRYSSRLDVIEAAKSPTQSDIPSGGEFTVEFPAKAPDPEKTLRLIVDAYNHSNNPGRFEVRPAPDAQFYLVGTAARDEKDAVSPQPAAFDSIVTLPSQERPLADTIQAVGDAITAQIHVPITLGVAPQKTLAYTNATVGGSKVAARELLHKCLAASTRRLYWYLLYDPSSKGYFLDVHTAPAAK